MILQLAFVLTAIIIGARLGGIGLGVMGGVGLAILTFVFGLQPTAPPIDVMLMIAAVISAASCMQAAGGLDYMVKLAEHLLRKNPSHVTLLSPLRLPPKPKSVRNVRWVLPSLLPNRPLQPVRFPRLP